MWIVEFITGRHRDRRLPGERCDSSRESIHGKQGRAVSNPPSLIVSHPPAMFGQHE